MKNVVDDFCELASWHDNSELCNMVTRVGYMEGTRSMFEVRQTNMLTRKLLKILSKAEIPIAWVKKLFMSESKVKNTYG